MNKRRYAMIYWNQSFKAPTLLTDVTCENLFVRYNEGLIKACTMFSGVLLIPSTSVQYVQLFELETDYEYNRVIEEKKPEILLLDTTVKKEE